MITVEECIVQSLYYRLVLITVRRGKQDATATSARSAAGCGAAYETAEVNGDSSTKLDTQYVEQLQDTATSPNETDLDLAAARYELAQGLGFLSLGPQLQCSSPRSSQQNNGMEMIQHSSISSNNELLRSLNVPAGETICVTRNVRTILEAGDTKLEQAFLRAGSSGRATSTEIQPLWRFGSSLGKVTESSSTETTARENSIVSSSHPLIDLRSCDQFSVVRMEDLRNPSSQAIMMVQTSESHDLLGGASSAKVPGVLHSELVGSLGALYVEGAGGLTRRKAYPPLEAGVKKQSTVDDTKSETKEAVHEMDSGIWDMMHALESGNEHQLFSSSSGNSLAHVDLFQTTKAVDEGTEYEEEFVENLHRSPSDELQGTYKMFQISDTVGAAASGDAFTNAQDCVDGTDDGSTKQRRGGLTKKASRDRDRGGLSDALEPVTVVNFAIHRIEVPIVRLETITGNPNYSKKCLNGSVGTQVSADASKSIGYNGIETNERRSSDVNISDENEPNETLRSDQSVMDNRIRKLCVEIQNLTANEQSAIEQFCAKSRSQSRRSSRCTSPFTTDCIEGNLLQVVDNGYDETESHESRHAQEAYRDIVEITSVESSGSSNRYRRKSGARRESEGWLRGGSVRKSKSERSSPRTSRLMNANEFSRCEKSPHSADGSPTRQYFAINSPELELLPLRASSPCLSRMQTGRGQLQANTRSGRTTLHSSTSSVGGHAENDARSMTTTINSSLGNLCDESLEVIEFERFTDWMGELPDALHNVPMSSISIPGSHICVAIEKDMRVDMDFSKCNYEMAEFLRKLPNLAIFNAFRSQMKAVWKAWMPKQCLSVQHQLEAGARYLDVRVTKYLSAFYGEHGLYTRQLKKYLKEIRLFIEEHPSEVVILHFELSDHLDRADKRRLITVLFQVFGSKMACSSGTTLPCPTLRWMWDNHKQLVVYFPDNDMEVVKNHIFGGLVWSDDTLDTVSPKKQSVMELVACLDDMFTSPRVDVALPASGRIHVTKAVLSPDMSMVFGKFDYRSMHELARAETADAVSLWLASLRRSLNVVAVDFIGVGDVARNIIRLNYPDRRIETLI